MAYCSNCKAEKPDDQKFCNTCGAELVASAPAEQPEATEPQQAPAQPVCSAEQLQQRKEQAMNIFNKLGLGLQVAVIGAILAFVFSLITVLRSQSVSVGGVTISVGAPGVMWFYVIAAAASVVLVYFAQLNQGKVKALFVAGVIALGAIYVPHLFGGWGDALAVLAMLSGIAQLVGGFMALNETI